MKTFVFFIKSRPFGTEIPTVYHDIQVTAPTYAIARARAVAQWDKDEPIDEVGLEK